MYIPTEKYKEFLSRYQNFTAIVHGNMCKGANPETISKASLSHIQNKDPLTCHIEAFAEVGKSVVFPEADHWNDTSDDYAKKMVDSGEWEQIIPDEKYYREQLKDHDILTWALSEDGKGECNDKPGMNGGNTTTGFLIKASGDYPTLAYAICSYVPSGVFPLAEVLSNQEKFGSGLKAKLIYIHRWIG